MTTITGKVASHTAIEATQQGQTITGSVVGRNARYVFIKVPHGQTLPVDPSSLQHHDEPTAEEIRVQTLVADLNEFYHINADVTADDGFQTLCFRSPKTDGETVCIWVYPSHYEVGTSNPKRNQGDHASQNQRRIVGYETLTRWIESRIN